MASRRITVRWSTCFRTAGQSSIRSATGSGDARTTTSSEMSMMAGNDSQSSLNGREAYARQTVRCTVHLPQVHYSYEVRIPASAWVSGTVALTAGERRVLRYASRGYSSRYVARKLQISPRTVEVHIRHIYEKLGVRSRDEMLDRVAELGYVG